MAADLNDYTIIKEGEAEILMHAKNEVFYNKTQVPEYALFDVFCMCSDICSEISFILCFEYCSQVNF